MTYANIDNYLLLKQLVAAVQLKRLGAKVSVSGVDMTSDSALGDKIDDVIYTIEADFTIPYAMIRGVNIHLDLHDQVDKMTLLACTELGPEEVAHLVPDSTDGPALNNLIWNLPNTIELRDKYKDNIANKVSFEKTRENTGLLVELTSKVLTNIRKWVEHEHDTRPVAQIIVLINCLETVDWTFAFTNDYYGVGGVESREKQIQDDFDLLEWSLGGIESLHNAFYDPPSLAGNDRYYALHLDAQAYAGNEASKYVEGFKEVAKRLYTQVTDMLKRIKDYFTGEGKDAADAKVNSAREVAEALGAMTPSAPVPEDSPARDPDTYIKALEGGVDFNEVMDGDNRLKAAMDKVRRAFEPVKNAATVGQLRAAYDQAVKASEDAIKTISSSIDKTVREATQAANKFRNPKDIKDDEAPEVAAGIKQENQEAMDKAKEETRKARIIGGMRNKVVAALTSIETAAKNIKANPPKSKFKG